MIFYPYPRLKLKGIQMKKRKACYLKPKLMREHQSVKEKEKIIYPLKIHSMVQNQLR